MSEITDQQIMQTRLKAAQLEETAARLRLDTARMEAESARRTIKLAEAVAQRMYQREMGVAN